MQFENTSTQGFNAILNFLNHLDSLVFWISSSDFKRQLYCSNAYQSIWGRTTEALQMYPESWLETILPSDLKKCSVHLDQRTKQGCFSTIAFRIIRPNGDMRWVKDTSCTLTNSEGKPIAIVGVGENVTATQWESFNENPTIENNKPLATPFMQDFLTIIKNEYRLNAAEQSNIIEEPGIKKKLMNVDGQAISISKRQAECLHYLMQGMSAKQTANILSLSSRSVETYLENLKRKLNCRSKLALISKLKHIEMY